MNGRTKRRLTYTLIGCLVHIDGIAHLLYNQLLEQVVKKWHIVGHEAAYCCNCRVCEKCVVLVLDVT